MVRNEMKWYERGRAIVEAGGIEKRPTRYYIQGKRSRVYFDFTDSHEAAKELLNRAKKSYPDEEWLIVEA